MHTTRDPTTPHHTGVNSPRSTTPGVPRPRSHTTDTDNAHLDPYTPRIIREPIVDRVDALVVGAGFAGLLTAARLKDAGLQRVRIIDTAGDAGGVWYWNRYPGAQCDVDGYCYLPCLEETGYIPTEKYPHFPEIHSHAVRIARHWDLYRLALFHTRVRHLAWDDDTLTWTAHTDREDVIATQYVVMATGAFTEPKLPTAPGLENFTGHYFHANRWDYAYTGGDPAGNLPNLADKSVAVIGTGATAIQIVPHLAAAAHTLRVFQRTPATVATRDNHLTDPAWISALEPGWQRRRILNFIQQIEGRTHATDLVNDGWTKLYRALQSGALSQTSLDDPVIWRRQAHQLHARMTRTRVQAIVADAATARSLAAPSNTPTRPCFHDHYLETFNNPNTELVDTHGRGVEQYYPDGIIANGRKYPVDCIIFATGFDRSKPHTVRAGLEITGRGGLCLREKWTDGLTSLHGILTSGFPNLFFNGSLAGQGTLSVNLSYVLSEVADHISALVTETHARGAHAIDAAPNAEAEWVKLIEDGAAAHRENARRSTRDDAFAGSPDTDADPAVTRSAMYPGHASQFFQLLRSWRALQYPGLEFRHRSIRSCP